MSPSIGARVSEALKKTTVEPFLFLVMFGYNARLVTLQSLLHDRACRISLNYSMHVCDNLDEDFHEYEQIQAVAYGNNLYNAYILISTVPALVIATFLGPWSDRYSRKYPILIALSGTFLDTTLQAIITSFPNASPNWLLASSSLTGMTGGLVIIMSSTYSYMSDITQEKSRQTRFAVLEFFTILATPTGSLVGGQVFRAGQGQAGYLYVMLIPPCTLALAWTWMRFFVQETKPRCSSLAIGFPYTRRMFKWGVPRYSYTTTLFSLVNAVVTLLLVPTFNKKLLVHEAAVGLVGILSLMAKMVLMSVTMVEYIIFYAWISGSLYACGGIAVRSRISKLVSRQELGRVFSLLATCESLTPVLGTIAMTQIYNSSLHFYPGLAYVGASIFLLPSAFIFAWMMKMPNMSFTQYQETEDAKKMKELQDVTAANFEYKTLN